MMIASASVQRVVVGVVVAVGLLLSAALPTNASTTTSSTTTTKASPQQALASTASPPPTTTNSPTVPQLYISNISSSLSNSTNNNKNVPSINQVPSLRSSNVSNSSNSSGSGSRTNVSSSASTTSAAAFSANGPSGGSVYTPNYNSQQNVLQLGRNMDLRLRNIRDVEMRVAALQEIFDSMHFTGSPHNAYATGGAAPKNTSTQLEGRLQQDLQLFSKRLVRKLQKASHVVLDLRDFFRYNITKFLMQSHLYAGEYGEGGDDDPSTVDPADADEEEDDDGDEEDEDAPETDFEIGTLASEMFGPRQMQYCLHTFIQPCHQFSEAESEAAAPKEYESRASLVNYDKQQIQILNYLKTDAGPRAAARLGEADARTAHRHSRYYEANSYIVEKIQALKADSSEGRLPADKLKFVGNHFRHIFFLSRNDHAGDQSERFYYDMHFRHLYASAIRGKYVVLLLDVGSAITPDLYELTKNYVSHILGLLSATDLISIVTVADEASSMVLFDETRPHDGDYADEPEYGVYYATRERKDEILNYIINLNLAQYSPTNHSLAFEYAFRMLQQMQARNVSMQPLEFVYVTRGLLSNLSEAMQVLQVIAQGQRRLQHPIVINTCAVVLDEKRIMYEKQFLTDVSSQNYSKYDINVSDWLELSAPEVGEPPHHPYEGKFFVLTKTHPDVVLRAATAIFQRDFIEPFLSESLEVHPPVVDAYSKDTLVSVTYALPPYGVVGVNLYLAELIEDVANYQTDSGSGNRFDSSYAFLVTRNGETVAHPAFPRPNTQAQTPFPVDIGFLENATDFSSIRHRMLHEATGSARTTVLVQQSSGFKTELLPMDRYYYWQSVLGIYLLCVVATTAQSPGEGSRPPPGSGGGSNLIQTKIQLMRYTGVGDSAPLGQYRPNGAGGYGDYTPAATDLLYHRLDLVSGSSLHTCRYFRQVATMDAVTLYLSAAAFESPFTYLWRISAPQTQRGTVETIMAYLRDSTGLLANPGLRPGIRREVRALYSGMQHLRKRHQDPRGSMRQHIIRRYIATLSGVLQMYPGSSLSSSYEASRRPWFRKAMQHPGRIVTTEPYLDAAGSGYIITVAHTILEGQPNALHSVERDRVVAVVALDLPYAYYYKLAVDSTPLCLAANIKCLLFENEGYLVAHPSMLEPSSAALNSRRPHEHLTHKESYLANDILYHKVLVRKLACANYQNRTLQRYYTFNTSLAEVLTNVVHGERTKYAIALVRGTNLFAAVLNTTNEGGGTAFCPCSTIDRTCLNCNRMDAHDCECPCECPMEMGGGGVATIANNYTWQYPYCTPPSETFVAVTRFAGDSGEAGDFNALPMCVASTSCDVYATQSECFAVMGCEWCQQDLDGNTFQAPFCSSQATCFNGVLSSPTPYGDLDELDLLASQGYNPSATKNSYSALGPVGGAIIVLVIVIGFAIYCYRHNLDPNGTDQFYIDSMQEENYGLPLSRFNFDDCQANDDPPGGGLGGSGGYDHPAAQRNLIHPADISPYHMSTGSSYRRPPNGESDHGYSTMTPHEDSSDHQCFTLAEPLLLNDKRHSKSDTLSISTSISSPTNRHQNYGRAKDDRFTATPKKFHMSSPGSRVYEQTTLPLNDANEEGGTSHYILAPVTVHRHMETSES